MLGTVRTNKPELPPELLAMKNRKVTSSVFAFTDKATVVCIFFHSHVTGILDVEVGMGVLFKGLFRWSTKQHKVPDT